MANDQAGLRQYARAFYAIGAGVADQGAMAAGHGVDVGPGAAVGQWDDAGKSYGAFVASKEPDILFDVGAECYTLGLKVE
ncbi:hypothetical protein D3C80_2088010 [compost metagenome]